MSGPSILELPPGHHPRAVSVTAGTADVFAVDKQGLTTPLCTVEQGAVIPAAREHVHLRVVARLDSALQLLDPVHYPDHAEGVAMLCSALPDRLGAFAQPFDGARPEHVPALLSEQVTAFLEKQAQDEAARRAKRAALDQRDRELEYERLQQSITMDGPKPAPLETDALVVALRRIGRRQGFTVESPSSSARGLSPEEELVGVAHASGFRYRQVSLIGDWDNPRSSNFLAFATADDSAEGETTPVALIATGRGYSAYVGLSATPVPVDDAFVERLGGVAYEITTPLSRTRAATWRDLVRVAMSQTGGSWALIAAMSALVALLGLLTPIMTQFVLGVAVPRDSIPLITQAGISLVIVAFASGAFSMVMFFAISRVTQEATARVQPALWDRMLSMPASFFREFTSGDLSVRVMAADALQQLVSTQVIGSLFAAIFSLVNVVLMFSYSRTLGMVGLIFIALTFLVLALAVRSMQSLYTTSVTAQLWSTSWVVQLLSGIGKIRLAGAESRLELPYLEKVREQMVALSSMTKVMGRVNAWFLFVVPLATAIFYLVVASEVTPLGSQISSSTFLAFTAAFATVFGAVNGLIAVLAPLASASPILRLMHPLMAALPEAAQHRTNPGRLQGAVEFRNVVFRYAEDTPIVLDRLSFSVAPGEFVALVGPSGSGKSSSIRLLLGFETPEDGQVLLDGRDLDELDLDLVRAQMGVVIQDGQVTRTSILNNILGVSGGSEEDAWRAAEEASLADDIRAMPMHMQTMVDPQVISGGQAQRILLARALVRKPRIVILDEATSALDNESQERVTEALNRLGATRIVVAHRLSTIQSADRILVIKEGELVEEGTFESLMAADGEFADLAKRQLA